MTDDLERRDRVLNHARRWADLMAGVERVLRLHEMRAGGVEGGVADISFPLGCDDDGGGPLGRLVAPTAAHIDAAVLSRRRSEFAAYWESILEDAPALRRVIPLVRRMEDEALSFGRLAGAEDRTAALATMSELESAVTALDDTDAECALTDLAEVAQEPWDGNAEDGDTLFDRAVDCLSSPHRDVIGPPWRLILRVPSCAARVLALLDHVDASPSPPDVARRYVRTTPKGPDGRRVPGLAPQLVSALRHPWALFRSVRDWVAGLHIGEHAWDRRLLEDLAAIPQKVLENAAVVLLEGEAGSTAHLVDVLERLSEVDRAFTAPADPAVWLQDHHIESIQAIAALLRLTTETAETVFDVLYRALSQEGDIDHPLAVTGGSDPAQPARASSLLRVSRACAALPEDMFMVPDAFSRARALVDELGSLGAVRMLARLSLTEEIRRYYGNHIRPGSPLALAIRSCEACPSELTLLHAVAMHPELTARFLPDQTEEWDALTRAAAVTAGAIQDNFGWLLLDPANRGHLVSLTRLAAVEIVRAAIERAGVPLALAEALRGMNSPLAPTPGMLNPGHGAALTGCTEEVLARLEDVIRDHAFEIRLWTLPDDAVWKHIRAAPSRVIRLLGDETFLDTGEQEELDEAAASGRFFPDERTHRPGAQGLLSFASFAAQLRHL